LLCIELSLADSATDASNAENVIDGESQCVVTGSQHSSYSESDFLLIASLQLGALKTLAVLLGSNRYTELLLVPHDSSEAEKSSSRLSFTTGHDDLQVETGCWSVEVSFVT